MHIGFRIKEARTRLKPRVTQQQIADLFGITGQAVASWEAGETVPDAGKYPQLRAILQVTYAWLIEGEGPPPPPDDPEVLLEGKALAGFRGAAAKRGEAATKRHRRA